MWRYGAMALVALTFSNENILFLGKISTHTPRHIKKRAEVNFARFFMFCDSDRINYIDPGPCHGLVIKQKKVETKSKLSFPLIFVCDSDRIQTCNLLIRSQMLYSVELRSQAVKILLTENIEVTPTGFKPVTF